MKGKDFHCGIAGAWDVRGGVGLEGRGASWWVFQKGRKEGEGSQQAPESLQNLPSALLQEH